MKYYIQINEYIYIYICYADASYPSYVLDHRFAFVHAPSLSVRCCVSIQTLLRTLFVLNVVYERFIHKKSLFFHVQNGRIYPPLSRSSVVQSFARPSSAAIQTISRDTRWYHSSPLICPCSATGDVYRMQSPSPLIQGDHTFPGQLFIYPSTEFYKFSSTQPNPYRTREPGRDRLRIQFIKKKSYTNLKVTKKR